MSQAFTILAIVGFSLAAVLVVVAVVLFFRLNIRQVRNDLTGKTATRSIAEIRARAKTRKRTSSEAGKKMGWDPTGPVKVPSGPLKSYTTDVITADIMDDEPATTYLNEEAGEEETTLLSQEQASEEATTVLSNASAAEEDEDEGKTTLLSNKTTPKIVSGTAVLLLAALAFTFGPGVASAEGALGAVERKPAQAVATKSQVMAALYGQSEEVSTEATSEEEAEVLGVLGGEALAPLALTDNTLPEFLDFTIDPGSPVSPEGTLSAAEKVTIIVEVSDPQVDADPVAPSGIDPDGIVVTVDGDIYPSSKVKYEVETLDHPERILIEFEAEAGREIVYKLADIEIDITDKDGNLQQSGPLSDHNIKGKDLEEETEFIIKEFSLSIIPAGISFSYDNTVSSNGSYYNEPRNGIIRINDSKFLTMVGSNKNKNKPVVTIENQTTGEKVEIPYSEFNLDPLDSSGRTWMCNYPFDEDGYYTVKVKYKSYNGFETKANDEFYIDTVDPQIDAATLTPTEPVVWNWITSQDEIELVFDVSDSFTGIDATATEATVNGESVSAVYNQANGTVTLTFSPSNERVLLDDIALTIYDMAGNECSTLTDVALRDLLVGLDADILGFIADGEAPDITVAYDNNEPQNAHYYNAPREATITIVESTLDLIKENDPNRVIATVYRGESKSTVLAKDFTDRDGDGSVWEAKYLFDTDGDYRIEAVLTDIAGNVSNTFTDAFTIDLTKPLISLSFDNNDAQSGMYFKAVRTATIKISETNFSEGLTSVVVTAADAAGASVAAPGISGWTQTKPGMWETTVSFTQELHYSIRVNSTDLAGNAAEEVEAPEFVIDMTAPIVRVDQVENNTAYANEIAPLVYFEDTNFESYRAKVTITGSNSESETVYLSNEQALTSTSRTDTYADIPYELRYDDVYTLTATIEDKAGNTAEQTVMFSVNRYGSNYELSTATQRANGAYLQEAQEIVIIETNVSGLDSSEVRLSRNDAIRQLINEEEYTTNTLGDRGSWARYEYVLPAELFEDDGYYRVLLSSTDVAGNFSDNLMEGKNITRDGALEILFAVDGTDPVASLGNIDDGATFFSPAHSIEVFASDNMEMEQVALYINDEVAKTWPAKDFTTQSMLDYELPAGDAFNQVSLVATDRAGNTTTIATSDVLVTNDVLRYVINTPSLLYPMIAVLSVLVALAAVLAVRLIKKAQKDRATEASQAE